jgi:hypothetical protein
LLLRNQSALLTKNTDLSQLTPDARSAILLQQSRLAWFIEWWPYFSAALLLGGISLIVWGAILWKARQNKVDERDDEEIAKLKADRAHTSIATEKTQHEVHELMRQNQATPEGAAIIREQEEQLAGAGVANFGEETLWKPPPSGGPVGTEDDTVSNITVAATGSPASPRLHFRPGGAASQSIETAAKVVECFSDALGSVAHIVTEVRVGSTLADVGITWNVGNKPNLLVDVRTVRSVQTRPYVDQAVTWAIRAKRNAGNVLKAVILPVVFLILPDDEEFNVHGALDRVRQNVDELGRDLVDLMIIVGPMGRIDEELIRTLKWSAVGIDVVGLESH